MAIMQFSDSTIQVSALPIILETPASQLAPSTWVVRSLVPQSLTEATLWHPLHSLLLRSQSPSHATNMQDPQTSPAPSGTRTTLHGGSVAEVSPSQRYVTAPAPPQAMAIVQLSDSTIQVSALPTMLVTPASQLAPSTWVAATLQSGGMPTSLTHQPSPPMAQPLLQAIPHRPKMLPHTLPLHVQVFHRQSKLKLLQQPE
jgi:hypothetical protein